jgi:hypothetical protein
VYVEFNWMKILGQKALDSINAGNFTDQLGDSTLYKKDSALWTFSCFQILGIFYTHSLEIFRNTNKFRFYFSIGSYYNLSLLELLQKSIP